MLTRKSILDGNKPGQSTQLNDLTGNSISLKIQDSSMTVKQLQ